MSYTYNPKPSSTGVSRNRGAASNRSRSTRKPGETTQQQRPRNTSPQRNPPRIPAAGVRGHSKKMYQNPTDDETAGQDRAAAERGGRQGEGMEQRFQFRDSYTVISPNEKKRAQISKQAEKETRQYEEYKEKNKLGYVSLLPQTVGGAPAVTERNARQQQSLQYSQRNKFGARANYKSMLRAKEDEEAAQKKAKARTQTERNKEKDKDRQQRLDEDRRLKNEQFLRRVETQGKPKKFAAIASRSEETRNYGLAGCYQGDENDDDDDLNDYDEEETVDPSITHLREMFPNKTVDEITEAWHAAHGQMDRAIDYLMT